MEGLDAWNFTIEEESEMKKSEEIISKKIFAGKLRPQMTVADLKRFILDLTNNRPFLLLLPVENSALLGNVAAMFGFNLRITYDFTKYAIFF